MGCWNHCGTFGDGSCGELAHFIHCHNCPRYESAATLLLDRPVPPVYRDECTRQLALPCAKREPIAGSLILFRIGSDWLALPTRCFQEIGECRPIHSLPHQRKFILGLANVRGELLLCVSLSHFLGLGSLPDRKSLRTAYSRLLVMNWNGSRLCFPTHEVQGPRRFSLDDLKPAPASITRACAGLSSRVLQCEKQFVNLLEANLLCAALNRSLQ